MAYNTMAAMMYGQQLKTITRPNDAMNKQGIQSLSWLGLNIRICCVLEAPHPPLLQQPKPPEKRQVRGWCSMDQFTLNDSADTYTPFVLWSQ